MRLGGSGTPSRPGGSPSRYSSGPASPTLAPKQRTPASSRSNAPAGDTEIPPTTKPVSCSPAPPDARREPIDQAGHHGQMRIAHNVLLHGVQVFGDASRILGLLRPVAA